MLHIGVCVCACHYPVRKQDHVVELHRTQSLASAWSHPHPSPNTLIGLIVREDAVSWIHYGI